MHRGHALGIGHHPAERRSSSDPIRAGPMRCPAFASSRYAVAPGPRGIAQLPIATSPAKEVGWRAAQAIAR
jgi:hypothetical protein